MGCLKQHHHHDVIISMLLVTVIMCCDRAMGAMTIFNVINYGAGGNGRSDDSQAFLRAWKAACQGQVVKSSTPVVYVPSNRNFLLKPLTFNGPCKSSRIYFLVSGKITAPVKSAWGGNQVDAWMIFANIKGLVMMGKGTLDGQGSSWWPSRPCFDDPAHGMIFRRCDGLRLDGFSKINGPGSHIIVMSSNDAFISNLRIIAPGDSPNTDGIDISGSTKVTVRNSFISTGDDCIAITGGCFNIDVSGITCGPGHGISIGSLGSGDMVENVRVRNCTLKETLTGVRIKTLQGGSGYARKISFQGIRFEAVNNPIEIEQFYCPLKVNCKNYTTGVAVSDVSFSGISGTTVAQKVINLNCDQKIGCKNINLDRVYIEPVRKGQNVFASCFNAHGKATHTKPIVKCLLP